MKVHINVSDIQIRGTMQFSLITNTSMSQASTDSTGNSVVTGTEFIAILQYAQ